MKLVGSSRGIRSPEFHKKKEVERRVRYGLLALLVLIVVGAPIYFLRSEKLRVSDILVSGNSVTSGERIRETASAHLSGNFLWIIPKSSSLIIKKDEIEQSLLQGIPRLSSAEATLDGSQTLTIKVSERTPFALYCEDVSSADSPSQCFFLDATGYIFSEAPDFSGGVYRVYASEPALSDPIRSAYLPSGIFKGVHNFVSELTELGLVPKVLTQARGEFVLTLEGGTLMKWTSEQDLESLKLDLEAFLSGLKVKPERYKDLLYIDLRFENKVFYKFRE